MRKVILFLLGICSVWTAPVLAASAPQAPKALERTFAMIKPEAVQSNKSGHIIARIETEGLSVVAIKMVSLSKAEAGKFYDVHKGRPFYQELVDYISSGPVIVMVIEGENAVEGYRKLMGSTDPRKAPPGTLRGDFGVSIQKNAVHGSDSGENADKEVAFFFAEEQIYKR